MYMRKENHKGNTFAWFY